jgi:putative transposase
MPRIRYPDVITELMEDLAALERRLRGRPDQHRAQMLRLLKSGQASSLVAVARLIGYSERTVNRWWQRYQAGGLDALLARRPRRGPASRLTDDAWAGLEAAMRRGEVATLRDAQRYLRDAWQIEYPSLNGVWWQLRRRQARLKTGRRRHRRADARQQEEDTRHLWRAAAGERLRPRLGL